MATSTQQVMHSFLLISFLVFPDGAGTPFSTSGCKVGVGNCDAVPSFMFVRLGKAKQCQYVGNCEALDSKVDGCSVGIFSAQ